LLLVLSIAALAWGALVLATGGIEWRIAGVLFRSRAPDRALLVALTLIVTQALLFKEAFARDVIRASDAIRPLLPSLAIVLAIALASHAVYFGSFVAGGADSYGYVSQAYSWAGGTLPRAQPLPLTVPWPSGDASLAPLGYRPGLQPHTMVPTYAPGLPLLMAAFLIVGSCGPYLVVPVCAALAIWLTFALGRRADGPWTGALAALFAVTSPIVRFQSMWPMSDVPAAALWTGAAYSALGERRRDAFTCGVWTAAGLLVRPNLPVIPAVLFLYLLLSTSGRERWRRVALFALPTGLVVAGVAVLYTVWYGAPWKSGYGAAGEIFLASNVLPNLSRYPVWLWQSQSPLILLALLPLFRRGDGRPRSALWLCAALFLATLASYLVYSPFEEWWYLRFLLPAMPAFFVLMAAGLVIAARRVPTAWGRLAALAAVIILIAVTTRFTNAHAAPGPLRDGERRYADIGLFVGQSLPADAVVLAIQESGSARHYGGRMTIRWDLIDRDWTSRAVAELQRMGLHPYLLIEDFELPQFREWFGFDADAALPWALVARMRQNGGVSLFDMSAPAGSVMPVSLESGAAARCQGPLALAFERRR
jgi:hypothetical protein